ncbi:uncharacterized protein LOC112052202 [Bicyclus anynana]|uniref:Uncharacterized protein LOC112052202 n=1 Tax=Bicyclus anynana TaxID=110368 RepID=A0A6J1NGP5_BICAN|nr:uncharacterized protein LOC112052202 [Bicyclus anynana]
MPASRFNLYPMHDAKNNFEAMRPAPVCPDTKTMMMGHCQNIHISTNCYYGYHDAKGLEKVLADQDCEMVEVSHVDAKSTSPLCNTRKRSADHSTYPQTKRLREEVQIKKTLEPETIEKKKLEKCSEDTLEDLYWNLHGGNYFHLLQCP